MIVFFVILIVTSKLLKYVKPVYSIYTVNYRPHHTDMLEYVSAV